MKLLMAAVAFVGLVLAADPANKNCPVAGKPVDKAQTVEHKLGEKTITVGFCCGGCKGKFTKEPAKYEEALKKDISGK
jgi:YHS domain-containing protein